MKAERSIVRLMLVLSVLSLFSLSAMKERLEADERLQKAPPIKRVWGQNSDKEQEGVEEEEKERGDYPFEALRFRRLQMQDEQGKIPVDGMEKARQHVKKMKARVRDPKRLTALEPDSWTWLGPGNVGGRIRSIIIHPTNTATMWIGSVSGGIWRTDNAGASWFPVNDFMANLTVSTMVIDPTNPSFMYAGTGEQFAGDGLRGVGIFKSTDGGLTWNRLPGTDPAGTLLCLNPATCPWFYVNRLAISPNGATILAATGNGIWRSTDGGTSWIQSGGVAGAWFDIDFHPTNNQLAIASSSGNSTAVFSTNGGQTWTFANVNPPTTGRVEIAYAPSSPNIVYASVDQNSGDIYRSVNGGQNYTRVNTGNNFLGTQGGYDNIVWVNPQNPAMVIVGGIDLWRSSDGGSNLTQISRWQDAPASSAHADHHMIVAHPGFNNTTNRIVFFGNDGGIYRADDVATVQQTSGWTSLNNNLGITQFYGAAGSFTTDLFGNPTPVIVGGTQDNGTLVNTQSFGASWFANFGGDGGYCAADPTDPRYFYGEYVYLQIHRSTDGGFQSAYIFPGIADAGNPSAANFIAPFILDPNNSNTMLAGGVRLWRTNDVKAFSFPTWSPIWGPTGDNSPISAIAVSPAVSDVICVGHNNGDIYYTSNGTATNPTWFKIDRSNLPNRMVTRLVIDFRLVSTVIYATFGGFSPGNVFRTTDNGATWTDITGTGVTGLPFVPVRSLVYHPNDRNLLYVGTEIGIFTSDDGGATWDVSQGGPANVSVDDLFWMGTDLIAATHGRGLYRASGGIYVDCNYNGAQLGTLDQPFKTITAAINSLTTYRPIWIKPCTYLEPINTSNINKRFELRSFGGPVTIRQP